MDGHELRFSWPLLSWYKSDEFQIRFVIPSGSCWPAYPTVRARTSRPCSGVHRHNLSSSLPTQQAHVLRRGQPEHEGNLRNVGCYVSAQRHSVTSQHTWIFSNTAVITSDVTSIIKSLCLVHPPGVKAYGLTEVTVHAFLTSYPMAVNSHLQISTNLCPLSPRQTLNMGQDGQILTLWRREYLFPPPGVEPRILGHCARCLGHTKLSLLTLQRVLWVETPNLRVFWYSAHRWRIFFQKKIISLMVSVKKGESSRICL